MENIRINLCRPMNDCDSWDVSVASEIVRLRASLWNSSNRWLLAWLWLRKGGQRCKLRLQNWRGGRQPTTHGRTNVCGASPTPLPAPLPSQSRTQRKLFKNVIANQIFTALKDETEFPRDAPRRAIIHPTPPLLFCLFTGRYILVKLCHDFLSLWSFIDTRSSDDGRTNGAGSSAPPLLPPSPRGRTIEM